MAIRSGFFNSVGGDRKYDASKFAEYFASFIGNGVFPNPSNNLQVLSNDDMTVTVKAGKAWINGYILINDDDYILTLDPADGVLNRIDRIVARYDTVDREIRLEVKKGTFASQPVAPGLQRDADAYELGLADIYVAAGAVSISQANITDLRMNSNYCGIVAGTVNQIDATGLFAQYQAAFEDWFEELKDVLDDNTAANLLNLINQNSAAIATKADRADLEELQQEVDEHLAERATLEELGHVEHGVYNTTLDTTWSGSSAPFIKTQAIAGILATDNPIVDVVMSGNYATDEARQSAWGHIYRITTANGSITLYAKEKPTVQLPIQLKVVR